MWKFNVLAASLMLLNLISFSQAASFSCDTSSSMNSYCYITNFGPAGASASQAVTFNAGMFDKNQIVTVQVVNPSKLGYMPTTLFTLFPNLQFFYLTDSFLTNLVADNFGNCGQLSSISMTNTNVTVLPNGVGSKCSQVTSFFSYQGQLQIVEANAFQGMSGLVTLMLSYNQITCIQPKLFASTPNLVYIGLSNNKIASIDPSTFSGLNMLSTLMLENNLLTALPAMQFASNTIQFYTIYANFYFNSITSIDPAITGLFDSQNVAFGFNDNGGTSCIPVNSPYTALTKDSYLEANATFSTCYSAWKGNALDACSLITTTPKPCASDKICRYYLDYMNRYTCVLDGVDSIITSITGTHISPLFTDASVTAVYFTNSILSRVSPILFSTFPNLEFLSVANSSLSVVNDFTFTTCGSQLKKIDLSYNGIFHITDTALQYCTSLQILDLTGNPLDYISSSIYKYDPALQTIVLSKVLN